MPAYQTFAIAGAGNLGSLIAKSLIGAGFQVSVLTRSKTSESAAKLAAAGAKLVEVDYASDESVKAALSGNEVVLNTLGSESFQTDVHARLPQLAKDAGAQLYVPNEWGLDVDVLTGAGVSLHPIVAGKTKLSSDLPLPSLQFHVGLFASYLAPLFQINHETKTATVVGPGTVPFAATAEADVADFVAAAFTKLSKDQLENRRLRVSANPRYSPVELIAKIGADYKIEHADPEQTKAASEDLSTGLQSFFAWFGYSIYKGGLDFKEENDVVGFTSKVSLVDAVKPKA